MNLELIKIINQNNQQLVSARELHSFLEISERFSAWFERMLSYGFVEDIDYASVKTFTLVNNGAERELQDYHIKLDMAKEISMIQRSEKGKQARLYFIDAEKQLKEKQNLALPQTYIQALEALIEKEKEKEALQLENENLSTALDNLLDWVSIIKVSRFNKISEKTFSWQKLKIKSRELGYTIKKAESPRYGYQNLYNITVFKALYPQFNYNFTDND